MLPSAPHPPQECADRPISQRHPAAAHLAEVVADLIADDRELRRGPESSRRCCSSTFPASTQLDTVTNTNNKGNKAKNP